MVFSSSSAAQRDSVVALYAALVGQARAPGFYAECGVPDSIDGRFDMIVLMTWLVLRRLQGEGEAGARLGQALFDLMLADMDRNLREMGVGDLGVGRRVKAMVEGFYGRVASYDEGLAADGDDVLRAALARNLYGTIEAAPATLATMAGYVRAEDAALAAQKGSEIMAGRVRFTPPPNPRHTGDTLRR